jgi:hypothetical protein
MEVKLDLQLRKRRELFFEKQKGRVPGQKPNADIDVFNGDQSTFNQHFGERAPANPSN